jgi:hypothetical protein
MLPIPEAIKAVDKTIIAILFLYLSIFLCENNFLSSSIRINDIFKYKVLLRNLVLSAIIIQLLEKFNSYSKNIKTYKLIVIEFC